MRIKTIPIDLDESKILDGYKFQPGLTEKLDNLDDISLNQELINEIVLWKVDRYVSIPSNVLKNLEQVKSFSKGDHRKSENILVDILNIKGIDLPLASTILRFRNPDVFQIIDRHAYRAIYGKKYSLYHSTRVQKKIDVYFDYLDKLIELCEKSNYGFNTIDRTLYVYDKKYNGSL